MSLRTRAHADSCRRAFGAADLFWLILILLLLISILLPSLARGREKAKRAVCAANQRGIAQACFVYANDHHEWFPHHDYEASESGRDHGVRWIGAMGSNEWLKISESSTKSPKRNHPSRSFFLLVTSGMCSPKQFICPSTGDISDDLRNRGPDVGGRELAAAQPGINRFDFRGYSYLSYGYQLPYGPSAQPNVHRDPRMALLADKGPYFAEAGPGLPGSGTVRDGRSSTPLPTAGSAAEVGSWTPAQWRTFNSRSHGSEGQNVTFCDGHVAFSETPTVGVSHDNIYTLAKADSALGAITGMIPDADETIGPLTNTDSFIVP